MSSPDSQPLALPNSSASVSEALGALRSGKLVILPTETVYGIAFNLLSPSARQRVKDIKNLTTTAAHWVIHVGALEDLSRYVPQISALGRRLIQRAWPGPVAFQLRLSAADAAALQTLLGDAAAEVLTTDGSPQGALSATFRCPDAPVTQDILSACVADGFPVAIIGAALPGTEPATDLATVAPSLLDKVDAIIDGGPTRDRKPSTLVRIDQDNVRVLRPGVIDERIILRLADLLILFICSGNTCRSPMAAGLAAKLLAERLHTVPDELAGHHVLIQSAGLQAARGLRATPEAIDAAGELGAHIASHLSQPATSDLLRRADVIYTMTGAHRDRVLEFFPSAAKKTHRLDPDGDIDDPIGADAAVYREVAERLTAVIARRLDEIAL